MNTNITRIAMFVALAFAFATASAQATIVNLSTGLDAFDTLITIGNTPDAHWTVDQIGGGTAPAKVVGPGFADWPGDLGRQRTFLGLDYHRPDNLGQRSLHPRSLLSHFHSHAF